MTDRDTFSVKPGSFVLMFGHRVESKLSTATATIQINRNGEKLLCKCVVSNRPLCGEAKRDYLFFMLEVDYLKARYQINAISSQSRGSIISIPFVKSKP